MSMSKTKQNIWVQYGTPPRFKGSTRGQSTCGTHSMHGQSTSQIRNKSLFLGLHSRTIHKSNPEKLLVFKAPWTTIHKSNTYHAWTIHDSNPEHESGPWVGPWTGHVIPGPPTGLGKKRLGGPEGRTSENITLVLTNISPGQLKV